MRRGCRGTMTMASFFFSLTLMTDDTGGKKSYDDEERGDRPALTHLLQILQVGYYDIWPSTGYDFTIIC
jgi:hypothetical protein